MHGLLFQPRNDRDWYFVFPDTHTFPSKWRRAPFQFNVFFFCFNLSQSKRKQRNEFPPHVVLCAFPRQEYIGWGVFFSSTVMKFLSFFFFYLSAPFYLLDNLFIFFFLFVPEMRKTKGKNGNEQENAPLFENQTNKQTDKR